MASDEAKDGCELDFTKHPTSPAEVEDYLIPEGEEEDAAGELLHRVRPLVQLPLEVLRADDRPGDQVGKLGDGAGERIEAPQL